MVNKKFEIYKVKREIKKSGIEFEFERPKSNAFKEYTDRSTSLGKLRGLYHEQNGHIQSTPSDAAQVRTKKIPAILCLHEDVALLDLRNGDVVKINSKTFKVTGIVNIQEWNAIADISLEVVDDGVRN